MKSRLAYIQLIIVITVLFLLSGCNLKDITIPKPSDESPASSAEESSSSSPDDILSVAVDAPAEYSWTLSVDQTIPVVQDGFTVNYTLLLVAQKAGGTDVNGLYQGAAYIGCNFDASQMNNEVMKLLGGFEMNAFAYDQSIEVVSYDVEAFSEYGVKEGKAPIAPVTQYHSMALISPEMSGFATLNPNISVQGEQVEANDSAMGTEPVAMKITIDSGKVRVTIPSLNIGYSFEGTLTSEPLQAAAVNQVGLAIERIDSILEEKASDDDSGSGSGGLGDILNQFKPG